MTRELCAAAKAAVAANGACPHATSATMASNGECAAHRTAAVVASNGECAAHRTSAAVASNGEACAQHHGAAAVASGECCAGKKASASSFAVAGYGSGGSCTGRGMAETADFSNHADCDACADMAACAEQLRSTGSQTQVVPLKNGVMFVYTADSPSRVRAVQAAVSHRTERLTAMTVAGDKAKLCPECKNIRGAIASGKLSRETVNIEGGCLTLMTSSDPTMVTRLRTMAGLGASRHVKS
jgi:hypothetical protein